MYSIWDWLANGRAAWARALKAKQSTINYRERLTDCGLLLDRCWSSCWLSVLHLLPFTVHQIRLQILMTQRSLRELRHSCNTLIVSFKTFFFPFYIFMTFQETLRPHDHVTARHHRYKLDIFICCNLFYIQASESMK